MLKYTSFQSTLQRAKVFMHDLVQRVGFMGILLCASVSIIDLLLQRIILKQYKGMVPDVLREACDSDILERY